MCVHFVSSLLATKEKTFVLGLNKQMYCLPLQYALQYFQWDIYWN